MPGHLEQSVAQAESSLCFLGIELAGIEQLTLLYAEYWLWNATPHARASATVASQLRSGLPAG